MRRDDGFTLVEVMVSMLIGTIGLLGTIAVQQTIISASKNANDAAVAMRLASQKLEELGNHSTENVTTDQTAIGLKQMSTLASSSPVWYPKSATNVSIPEYVDAEGAYLRDSNGFALVPHPSELGRYRWRRQWKVLNSGNGLPYVITVIVTYNNDVGDAKTTRLDLERRKSWL